MHHITLAVSSCLDSISFNRISTAVEEDQHLDHLEITVERGDRENHAVIYDEPFTGCKLVGGYMLKLIDDITGPSRYVSKCKPTAKALAEDDDY